MIQHDEVRSILKSTSDTPKAAQSVLADALRLDPDARAELVAELLSSLDGPDDRDAETAWNAEIARRIEAIEAGTMRLEPWEQVKRRFTCRPYLDSHGRPQYSRLSNSPVVGLTS